MAARSVAHTVLDHTFDSRPSKMSTQRSKKGSQCFQDLRQQSLFLTKEGGCKVVNKDSLVEKYCKLLIKSSGKN